MKKRMPKDFRRYVGKVAIVTASTKGIGLAIARRLAEEGAKVVISSRREANVNEVVKELKSEGLDVIGVVCHVANAEDRKNLIDTTLREFGKIDVLVSNAAVNPFFGATLDTPEAAWDKIFEVNVKATFLLSREVVPHMRKIGGGSILFVASVGGYKLLPGIGAYNVSKTAMIGLSKLLAGELAADNIRVNALAPGIIKTLFAEVLWKDESSAEASLATIPMGRFGVPEEISGAAAFLCSDEASYITGETMIIAGGSPASRL